MYTQCPDCETAFRVTADILRQAAGKVRCGGCGLAFNALLYLSETKPGIRRRTAIAETLPELRPEVTEHLESLPRPALSAAQSAALLKTLEQLAGEDIRLEDTGVEWRLLGREDDDANNDDGVFADVEQAADDASGEIDVEEYSARYPDARIRVDEGYPDDAHRQETHHAEGHNGEVIEFAPGQPADTGLEPPAEPVEPAHHDVSGRLDEILDAAPTPLDEILVDAPNDVEAVEVFAYPDAAEVEAQDVFAHPETRPEDVLRFDDNTGLPDNFDLDSLAGHVSAAPAIAAARPGSEEPTPAAPEIAFGEPEEWGDLLGEVEPVAYRGAGLPAATDVATMPDDAEVELFADTGMQVALTGRAAQQVHGRNEPTLADELAALPDDYDEEGEPEAADGDVDTLAPFDPVAAAGIDLSGIYASASPVFEDDSADEPEAVAADDKAEAVDRTADDESLVAEAGYETDAAASNRSPASLPGDAADLIADAAAAWEFATDDDQDESGDAILEPGRAEAEAGEELAAAADNDAVDSIEAEIEADFALEAEAEARRAGDDAETGSRDETEAAIETDERDEAEESRDSGSASPFELALADDASAEPVAADDNAAGAEMLAPEAWESETAESLWDKVTSEDPPEDSAPAKSDAQARPAKPFPENTGELELELVAARLLAADEPEFDPTRTIVPPPTDEEHTVNMLIDADLMRLALTDEDGMASTIVIENRPAKGNADGNSDRDVDNDAKPAANSLFETIVMEGDFASTALEQKRLAAEAEARAHNGAKEVARQEAARHVSKRSRKRRLQYGLVACIVALALLLVGQFVHQSRAELATIPAVGEAIAPIYRAVGAPVTPEWNVRGWRFEATRGSTNQFAATGGELPDLNPGEEVLTIYSRVGNASDAALPLPLITVALTDRFEEVIGSKVLDPADYLATGVSSKDLVQPGGSFEAVISIAAPGDDATGFNLNVCYREQGGLLRCALEDFRK